MKAEFAESQLSLAQRVTTRIADNPISNRHLNNNAAVVEPAAKPAGNNPALQQAAPNHLTPNIQRIPKMISRQTEHSTEQNNTLGGVQPPPPPCLPIDPLELPTLLPAAEAQNIDNSPYTSDEEIPAEDPFNPSDAAGTPLRSRRGTRNKNTTTPGRTTTQTKRPAPDLKKRAEATKEKNRRAQQRFRHKQKSRLELLECEVTRLRQLLTEKGIDPEEPGVASRAEGEQKEASL
jgi:hypothetical protein